MTPRYWTCRWVFAAAGLAGCGHPQAATERPVTPVTVHTVETYSEETATHYSGSVEPNSRVDLSFRVSGYVDEIRQVADATGRMRDIQGGDFVKKGDLLAHIREADYLSKVDQANSQLAQSRAALRQAQSQTKESQAAAEHARLDFTRAQNLFKTESLTKPEFDAARTKVEIAEARVDQASSAVAVAEARVTGAASQLQDAQSAVNDCGLRAPMDGVVLHRVAERGTLAGPGLVVFSLADTSSVKVVFGAPDSLLPLLKLGGSVALMTEAIPGAQFSGTISKISPAGDPKSRVFDVSVAVPNPRNRIKIGMIASLLAPGSRRSAPVPVVPLSSILRSKTNPEGYAVLVVEDRGGETEAHTRDVTLGQVFNNVIGISQGLKRGERVVANGAALVRDGEKVRVIQ